jgi:tetratricopeptide (TPR) repeat protein
VSFWDRLKSALKPPVTPTPEPPPEPPSDESWLRTLLQRLADADEGSSGQAIGGEQFWAAIARLQSNGRERTAIELLGRFVTARPADHALAMRLAELLVERRDDRAARPLLEKLRTDEKLGLRARFLHGELLERAGEEDDARREYESVLAVELDFPRARARADALHKAPVVKAAAPAAPTIAGLPEGGAAFAGRYRLVRELGRGASGAVYVAHDQELDRELAIKILHPHTRAQKQAESRARAWLEARIAAGIRHPGVVAIYDLDEERQLLAMELCSGGALRDLLQRGPLDAEVALRRAAELSDTLAAVHQRGVVHGDVKPANLLFRGTPRDGDLVLGDFGIARLTGDASVPRRAGGARDARVHVPGAAPRRADPARRSVLGGRDPRRAPGRHGGAPALAGLDERAVARHRALGRHPARSRRGGAGSARRPGQAAGRAVARRGAGAPSRCGFNRARASRYPDAVKDKPRRPSEAAQEEFSKANWHNNHGRYREAVRHYYNVLKLSPRHYKAMTNLGNAFFDLGRNAEAVRAYSEALEVKPDYAKAWCNLGNTYLKLGLWERARETSAEAARLDPGDETGWNNLGIALTELGRIDEAIRALKKAEKIYDGDPRVHFNLGLAHLAGNDLDGAREQLEHLEWLHDETAILLGNAILDWIDAHPRAGKPTQKTKQKRKQPAKRRRR